MAITGAPGGTGVNESFKTVDTDTKRILFRYTTRFGDSFSVGDTVNGWEISEVAYFGNKLRAGYMIEGEGKIYLQSDNYCEWRERKRGTSHMWVWNSGQSKVLWSI